MRIMARVKEGKKIKTAYCEIVEGLETEKELMRNRIYMRKYLREFAFNQAKILDNTWIY
jgi:hypothetical protein